MARNQAKTVITLARYAMKTDGQLNGIVVYAVRSSNGQDVYQTTLVHGKATGCTCPAKKPCYHMAQLEAIEAARPAVSVGAQTVSGATPAQTVKKALALLPGKVAPVEQSNVPAPVTTAVATDISKRMEAAPLTKNSGFQLMR